MATHSSVLGEHCSPSELQCSLENPRDRGAWWAAIYGVTQSRTRLKWLSSNSSSSYFAPQTFSLSFPEMIAFTNYLRNLKPWWAWKPSTPPNSTTYMLLLVDILGLFFLQSPRVRSVQGQPVHHILNPTHSWTCLHFSLSVICLSWIFFVSLSTDSFPLDQIILSILCLFVSLNLLLCLAPKYWVFPDFYSLLNFSYVFLTLMLKLGDLISQF